MPIIGRCGRAAVRSLLLISIALLPAIARVAAVQADTGVQMVEPSTVNYLTWTFRPNAPQVYVGDTITWTNSGSAAHTVTAVDGSFDSGSLDPRTSFSLVAPGPGSISYYCTFHPWMTGTLTVVDASGAAPADDTTDAGDTETLSEDAS